MKPVRIFDTDKLHNGTEIKYTFNGLYGKVFDWGYGEIVHTFEDRIFIDYYSEVAVDMDYGMNITKKYCQISLSVEDIGDVHVLEILGA
jgi:hypothetical protein